MEGRDFLAMATAPVVAVITDTARIVPSMLMSKNNIPDLVHYLRPFGLARHSHGNTIVVMEFTAASTLIANLILSFSFHSGHAWKYYST